MGGLPYLDSQLLLFIFLGALLLFVAMPPRGSR